MSQYLEVDVPEGANSPMSLVRMFSMVEQPKAVSSVWTSDSQGKDAWCDVTGWSANGPCPAKAVIVEDSGDGQALLIFGGEEGIRLRRTQHKTSWNINDKSQWGEACLLLPLGTEFK